MAPRKPKPSDDDASSTTSELPAVLKPKTEKAKVTKPKVEKPKTEKDKSKTEKPKAVKKEKGDEKKEKSDGDSRTGEKGKGKDGKEKEGKEKVKAVTGDEAIEVMRRYLKAQNRPYSATEVSANLHGKVSPPFQRFKGKRGLMDTGLENGRG